MKGADVNSQDKNEKLYLTRLNNIKNLFYEALAGEGVHLKDEGSRNCLQWMWRGIVQFIVQFSITVPGHSSVLRVTSKCAARL
jgi:hypothetical protein